MFGDDEKKRIFVEESVCNGCHMCEVMCSFVNTQNFYPSKANIKVINYEWKGKNKPIISCDITHPDCQDFPQCVAFCPTGALVWSTRDEFASMVYQYHEDLEEKPSLKARAPWCRR